LEVSGFFQAPDFFIALDFDLEDSQNIFFFFSQKLLVSVVLSLPFLPLPLNDIPI